MKRIMTTLVALVLLCSIFTAGAASPLQEAHQASLEQFVATLKEQQIPQGTQEMEVQEDEAGTQKAAIIQVLPEGKLWITYWEDGATDIQLQVMADATTDAQREQIFVAFLDAFAKVEGPDEALLAYGELEAAFLKASAGVVLEKTEYNLMLGEHEGEYMLSILYP